MSKPNGVAVAVLVGLAVIHEIPDTTSASHKSMTVQALHRHHEPDIAESTDRAPVPRPQAVGQEPPPIEVQGVGLSMAITLGQGVVTVS
jgi:hypothetical protein